MRKSVVLASLAGLALAGSAFGQAGTNFTITDANAVFLQGATLTSGTLTPNTADFRVTGAAGTDHAFRHYWWYRVQGDNRETAFNNQTGPTGLAGNTATQNFAFPSFSAGLTYQVNSLGATYGQVTSTVVVTNTTAAQIQLHLFNYADYFFNGQDAGDVVSLTGPNTFRVTDAATQSYMEHEGIGAVRWEAGPFGSAALNQLTNTVVDDLANTVDGTAGDREGAWQWTLTLDPGQSATVMSRLAVVPAPGAMALLGLGGLIAGRRRR